MKIILYILLLVGSNVFGQLNFSSCPIDSSTRLVLSFDFFISGTNDSTFFYRSYITDQIQGEDCERFSFDWKTFEVQNAKGDKIFDCVPNQIVELNIHTSNMMFLDYKFDLDSYEMLTSISLPALEKIHVMGGHCKINFDEWKACFELIESQTLLSVHMEVETINDDWIESFLPFGQLNTLMANNHLLSPDVVVFRELKKLDFSNMYSHFSHSVVNLDSLVSMPKLDNRRSSDLFPQITFFANELQPTIQHHPFNSCYKAINEKLVSDSLFSGTMVITLGDILPGYIDPEFEKDSIALGNVVNGIPEGVWRFSIPDFEAFGEGQFYFYDFSDSTYTTFPENGFWEYSYPIGGIAISGKFKNYKKNGKWKFYNPDGFLSITNNYCEDEPHGLSIERIICNGKVIENRRYFLSPDYAIYGAQLDDGKFRVFEVKRYEKSEMGYYLDASGRLWKIDEDTIESLVPENSKKYKKVLRSYIRKVFPDKKISIKDLIFEK